MHLPSTHSQLSAAPGPLPFVPLSRRDSGYGTIWEAEFILEQSSRPPTPENHQLNTNYTPAVPHRPTRPQVFRVSGRASNLADVIQLAQALSTLLPSCLTIFSLSVQLVRKTTKIAKTAVIEEGYNRIRLYREIHRRVPQLSPRTFRSGPIHVRHRRTVAKEVRRTEERARTW